ncbi:MAG: hypothetical protein ABSA39_08305 [Edaphobacter sp.]
MCDSVQYPNITRARFSCLQQSANQQVGLDLTGDSGSATDSAGANTVTWNFNESTQVLTLQVTKTPYPCWLVRPKIDQFVASCP